jgi:hypothetical protein
VRTTSELLVGGTNLIRFAVLNRFASEYEEPSVMEDIDRMYELKPHPTGDWTKVEISKV